MFKLDNKELEAHVLKEIEPIQEVIDLKDTHFFKNDLNEEGTYIFSDQQGYHWVYSERGSEITHKVTDNLFEITFWTISMLINESDLLMKNINEVKNKREYIFKQRLRLLELVGENYRKVGEVQISEILKENPL